MQFLFTTRCSSKAFQERPLQPSQLFKVFFRRDNYKDSALCSLRSRDGPFGSLVGHLGVWGVMVCSRGPKFLVNKLQDEETAVGDFCSYLAEVVCHRGIPFPEGVWD